MQIVARLISYKYTSILPLLYACCTLTSRGALSFTILFSLAVFVFASFFVVFYFVTVVGIVGVGVFARELS